MLGIAGCGGGSDSGSKPAEQAKSGEALDPTKGKRGGSWSFRPTATREPGSKLWKIRNPGVHQLAGFTHDGLLEHRNGTPAFDGGDIFPQPNLAQAMPEQPDPQTYIYKLRPAKFHNGRQLMFRDVKYTYERNARSDSAWRLDYTWLDTVTTPDANTVVIKTKYPFSDALMAMTHRYTAKDLGQGMGGEPGARKEAHGNGPLPVPWPRSRPYNDASSPSARRRTGTSS